MTERPPSGGAKTRRRLVLYGALAAAVVLGAYPVVEMYREEVAVTERRVVEAAMKSDLRDLLSAQEIYYGDGNYVYAPDLGTLGLTESEGVHVEVASHSVEGFGATATHDGMPEVACSVFVGETHALGPATESGIVACR